MGEQHLIFSRCCSAQVFEEFVLSENGALLIPRSCSDVVAEPPRAMAIPPPVRAAIEEIQDQMTQLAAALDVISARGEADKTDLKT